MRTGYPRHLAGFSYVGFQRYILTFCTFSRRSIFVDSGAVDLVNEQFLRAVLRDDEATRSVVKYALENPVRAGLVESVREYPFVGSAIHSREELIAFAYESG